jgi:hypothetical protein
MSVDIYVTATRRTLVANVNVTYNLGPMLRAAGMDWADFTCLRPEELTRKITATIEELKARPEHYRALNPPNGFGTYEGLITSLGEVLVALVDPANVDLNVTTWR